MPLTKKDFLKIEVNSMFEAGTIFEGMSDEIVVWLCQETGKHPKRSTDVAVFGLYYFNIEIGRMRGELLKNDEINWKQI